MRKFQGWFAEISVCAIRNVATAAFLILAFTVFLGQCRVGYCDSFRCKGKIVESGFHMSEVLSKCGEPDWRGARTEEKVEQVQDLNNDEGEKHWVRKRVAVEEWLYNFGPGKFMRVLTFRDKRLGAISSLGYGYFDTDLPSPKECIDNVDYGDRMPVVVSKCGSPSYSDRYFEEHTRKDEDGDYSSYNVYFDEWTYDFRPDYSSYTFKFEDGILSEIEELE